MWLTNNREEVKFLLKKNKDNSMLALSKEVKGLVEGLM
jgi:hypothetical protein